MERDRAAIRREFLVRNYREVIDYVALHGPAVWNTFVLCAGLLVVTLIVNPLCAYALSRYNLPSTYKILLFLLATMAFPAEVSAIPNFLLLKQLHLLNTYWALILPAMANGYAIFLLKGFFDSLPRELYEAGTIDGASEARMFTTITLPMSKPVLAVIALGTFTTAYGSFLWAFLVCQDPNKWTLMVWLSQMQSWAPMPVIFAALALAALPTLLVFIFCQNIIMRGIIVPTEKRAESRRRPQLGEGSGSKPAGSVKRAIRATTCSRSCRGPRLAHGAAPARPGLRRDQRAAGQLHADCGAML